VFLTLKRNASASHVVVRLSVLSLAPAQREKDGNGKWTEDYHYCGEEAAISFGFDKPLDHGGLARPIASAVMQPL
jgi:hypothetical protein